MRDLDVDHPLELTHEQAMEPTEYDTKDSDIVMFMRQRMTLMLQQRRRDRRLRRLRRLAKVD